MSYSSYTMREMKPSDWAEVADIYQAGIDTHIATYREVLPTWDEWNDDHLEICRLVAIAPDGKVVGFVALSPTSIKEAYSGVCEVSIYISPLVKGKGVGELLLKEEIRQSEEEGVWTLLSLIIEENTASLHLHEKCGFRVVGVRERPARMSSTGVWHNVVHMERRSQTVGQ